MGDKNNINEKDILDLGWKYFLQHAQQRISYFNFFVIFSGLLTTALLTTFQEKFEAHIIGVGIGIIQSLIAFVFWKIDDRNKYLTKHGENAIKEIEARYGEYNNLLPNSKIKIFTSEEFFSDKLKQSHENRFFLKKQFSHSKSFKIMFLVFFTVGLLGSFSSLYFHIQHINSQQPTTQSSTFTVISSKDIDYLKDSVSNISITCQKLEQENLILKEENKKLSEKLGLLSQSISQQNNIQVTPFPILP